jgi:F-type H+-transporting ATPase subunit delta
MEIVSKPARRYAQAFLDWVQKQGVLDLVRGDADRLRNQIAGLPDLGRFLGNYLIPLAIRKATLAELFEGHLHPATLRLIYFLEFKKRLGILSEILQSFQRKDEALRGVVRGRVVFARPVAPEVDRQVESWLATRFPAAEFRLESETDAALLGGVTIRVEDLFWDGSVVGGLRRMRRQLERPLPQEGSA